MRLILAFGVTNEHELKFQKPYQVYRENLPVIHGVCHDGSYLGLVTSSFSILASEHEISP